MSWTDKLDKSKYSAETIKKWKADEVGAKKQHKALMANPHRNLPDTAPARMAYDDRHAKSSALKNKQK